MLKLELYLKQLWASNILVYGDWMNNEVRSKRPCRQKGQEQTPIFVMSDLMFKIFTFDKYLNGLLGVLCIVIAKVIMTIILYCTGRPCYPRSFYLWICLFKNIKLA